MKADRHSDRRDFRKNATGIGFALWNFRGNFGILDSGSEDADFEDWHGHKLDRKLLDLIRNIEGV